MTDALPPLERILAFLASCGLPAEEVQALGPTLLPGVTLRAGRLVFSRAQLQWPGDLLHEAGHLAVAPAHLRASLDGTVALPAGVLPAGRGAGPTLVRLRACPGAARWVRGQT